MRFVVATHGHCFDGLASAVVFTRLAESVCPPQPRFEYRSCGYGVGQLKADDSVLDGDENAILDYRFCPHPKLTWYFDHHPTAFANSADEEYYRERESNGRFFYRPDYGSCTKLIADVARQRFQWHAPELDELVRWANIVDTAHFDSAEQAISRREPVMRMVSVVEHLGNDSILTHLIKQLLRAPLSEVASSAFIEKRYRPLGEKHGRFVERVRKASDDRGRVVYCDLTDGVLESVGKFVTYALYPKSTYSVMIGVLKSGVKISVGYNPWSGQPLDTDIGAICARYGGGGHKVVGGISFSLSDLERAREIARGIARELDAAES